MARRPRLLLFDFDGVLAAYDRRARCAFLAQRAGIAVERVQAALFGSGALEAASDRGELALPDYIGRLRAEHGMSVTVEDFIAARRFATRVDAGMLSLAATLAPQATLAIFTNNGDWFVKQAARIAPELSGLFGGGWVSSGQVRCEKPAPEAYLRCLAQLGGDAAETFFVDDRPDNVEGAIAAGLRAHHFQAVPPVRQALRAQGFELENNDAD